MKYFVTGIHTGSGKTLTSAILCEALHADYWKPVQTGMDERDQATVKSLVSNEQSVFHSERFWFKKPCSPHEASEVESVNIALHDFELPASKNKNLIIEGAGGVLVPLNHQGDFIIDLARKFNAQIILVSNIYLGSINHTLLTVSEINRRWPYISGIIFNGESNPFTEDIILKTTGLPCLLRINKEANLTKEVVKKYAEQLKEHFV